MSVLFDFVLDFIGEFVFEVLVCGTGRLALGLFGGSLRISSRHERAWIVGTGLAVWAGLGLSIWWLVR